MSSTDTPSAPPKKHRNLAQGVVAHISAQIRDGEINPGDKLPTESEIMRIQGVSRTVVREAISHMQAAGMVETRHGIGTFVLEPSASRLGIDPGTVVTMRDVLAILELRISLETETAGLAALRRSDEQLRGLREALDDFEANVAAGGDTVKPDLRFHLLIAEATGNPYFADIMGHLGAGLIPRARVSAIRDHGRRGEYLVHVNREHEEIYAAIARRDPDSARAAMRIHLTNSRERLRLAQEAAQRAASTAVPKT